MREIKSLVKEIVMRSHNTLFMGNAKAASMNGNGNAVRKQRKKNAPQNRSTNTKHKFIFVADNANEARSCSQRAQRKTAE